jgi:tRNA A37 threonylcarbamoyladenosine dehydratase
MKSRLLDINPDIKVNAYDVKVNEEFLNSIDFSKFTYVADCIDDVNGKLAIIKKSKENNVKIISSCGTGNKLDPMKFMIKDINQTSVCPLARVIRRELRSKGINHLTVVYSKEEPQNLDGDRPPASSTFVPISAGILIASKVVQDILDI